MRTLLMIAFVVASAALPGCSDEEECTTEGVRCDEDGAVERCDLEEGIWVLDHVCPEGQACVDGTCGSTENCGDGTCDSAENCGVCEADCGCSAPQTCVQGVCQDQGGDCGNGTCDVGETCSSCEVDCGCSGDATCVGGECVGAAECGDGSCDEAENCRLCTEDCGRCEAELDCEADLCSFAACDRTYSPIYFADDILAQPACAGATLPEWFSESRCFIEEGEWEALANEGMTCSLMYPYCPCSDGFYQWADPSLEFEFFNVDLADPNAVGDLEPFECGEVLSTCLCTPQCTDLECGPDGCGGNCGFCEGGESCDAGVCGTGSGDACWQCIEECLGLGLDSCCTGYTCYCYDDCQLSECPDGTELCCGPYGDCLCLANCPY